MTVHSFIQSAPPHIRDKETASSLFWKTTATLMLVWSSSVFFFKISALCITVAVFLGAALSEAMARLLFKKKRAFADPSTILYGLIFALIMPADLPFGAAVLGAWAGFFFGKEIFGGLGSFVFHPALAGRLFLGAVFPDFFDSARSAWLGAPLGLKTFDFLLGHTHGALGETCGLVVITAGGILIAQKLIRSETALLYLGAIFILAPLLGTDSWHVLFSGRLLLLAFFVVTDPVTTPLTPSGEKAFSLAAAGLTVGLVKAGLGEAAYLAILVLNFFVPWMDAWIKPSNLQAGRA